MKDERQKVINQLLDKLSTCSIDKRTDTKQAVLLVGVCIIGTLKLVSEEITEAIRETKS